MKDPKHPEALPQVSNNGTARNDLVQQRMEARRALSSAIDKLRECAPHGRDYQIHSEHYYAARELHRERMTTLTDLWAELECEAFAILYQGI